ncbi:TetR/AcrR family transcriptional regulator [Luteimonas saliphila]|uniref:TetR/AcrR family transcriptional regulator n=1 Tax=Luteimonas saliphila TaxID=2804919 RepID=UPI00192DE8B3|nr:TetR family transcriptional regulator C-terminal domain-containing protein [Luteimonas saliphila]
MPITIDSDARRATVVAAAADLIAESGLGAMTFRSLAARLSCSTTVISHYFHDKNELLLAIYHAITSEAAALRDRHVASSGRSPVQALDVLLPIAGAQRRIWMVWLCFWTAALFDADMLEQHRLGLAGTRTRLLEYLLGTGLGRHRAERAAEDICKALFGIAMQALFDPGYWTPARQQAAFRRQLEGLSLAD